MRMVFQKSVRLFLPMFVIAACGVLANDIRLFYTTGRTVVPWVGVILGYINPPDDYFVPRGEIAVVSEQSEYCVEYTNKYNGGYSVEFMFPGKMEITESVKTDLSFRCTFRATDGRTLRTTKIDNFIAYSDGRGSIGGAIAKYEVPKDLPIDDKLILRVEIDGSSRRKFFYDHPKATLVVVKSSDE